MLLNSGRFSACTCPECGAISKIKFNIFNFSGRKTFKVFCNDKSCSSQLWSIHETKDKYRISVNCPACEELHSYTISKRNFWSKKYFSFNCPNWDVAILYFGDDEKFIEKQMDMQDDNITDMLSGFLEPDDTSSVLYSLIECINEIAKSNNVKCDCSQANISMCIEDDKIILFCKNCKKTKIILPSEKNIDTLTKTGTIVLDDTILNS